MLLLTENHISITIVKVDRIFKIDIFSDAMMTKSSKIRFYVVKLYDALTKWYMISHNVTCYHSQVGAVRGPIFTSSVIESVLQMIIFMGASMQSECLPSNTGTYLTGHSGRALCYVVCAEESDKYLPGIFTMERDWVGMYSSNNYHSILYVRHISWHNAIWYLLHDWITSLF